MSQDYGEDWELRRRAYFRRRALREQAVSYKGGKCEICGYNNCLSALEFHHPDPLTKEFNISDRITSFEAIRAELDKCHLLCANHHREVHEGLHPRYLVIEGSSFEGDQEGPEDEGFSYTEELELNEILEGVDQEPEKRVKAPKSRRALLENTKSIR
jgi:hypothetical protein